MRTPGGAQVPAPSGTVTFLFTDIEASTQRWARDRHAMQDALRVHDRIMRDAIVSRGGYIFKTMGDAFYAAFETPESAVAAALDAQSTLAATDFPLVEGLSVRMAIDTGTADERDGDYFGPALGRAARLLALGHGGQVLLTRISADLVAQNPRRGTSLTDLGQYQLKDHDGDERVFQLVAPELRRDFPELRAAPQRPWLIPDSMRTRYFTGRDDLLARLRQELTQRRRAALSGLGGAGKTQTAIEYARRNRAAYPNGVFWVNAETIGGLASSFVEIAKALRLPLADSTDHDRVVESVLAWLNSNDKWLLILDNVDDRQVAQPFVPTRGGGDLLITSRGSVFPELGIPRAIELQDLNGDEAVRFLLARTGRDDADLTSRAAAAELVTELGNLPLALEQAAAYITETNASFLAYLNAFRKRRVALLEKAGDLVSHDTVAATWAANFEAVECESPAATDVLRIAALLAPDAIPFELFLIGGRGLGDSITAALADQDDLAMAEVLRPLARYSLIRSDATSRAFSVHRLVQEIAWAAVPEGERQAYVERTVGALDAAFPEVDFATWPLCERLVSHVTSILGRIDSNELRHQGGSRLFNRAGRYLWERGRYREAQTVLESALAIANRVLGPDHPDVALSLSNLANVHFYQGRYGDAQDLYERALAIRERAFGADHPLVATSLNNLASIYKERGQDDKARPLYERALAIREHTLGSEHVLVAASLNNLALIHYNEGCYREAQDLQRRALAIRERALEPDHPDVAASLYNFALVQMAQDRYREAQALHERALAIRERAFGSDHPTVATSLDGLATAYGKQSRAGEAEQLHARALAIRERALGPNHPDVAESLGGLAALRVIQGRYDEAEDLYERALTIRESALGPDSIFVAESLVEMASLRKEQKRLDEALAFYQRALTIGAKSLAPEHPKLVSFRAAMESLQR